MQDMEIQNGGKLTVRESQMAAFVNEGRIADVFGPGLYTLNTRTLPLFTNLMNCTTLKQSRQERLLLFSPEPEIRMPLLQQSSTHNFLRLLSGNAH